MLQATYSRSCIIKTLTKVSPNQNNPFVHNTDFHIINIAQCHDSVIHIKLSGNMWIIPKNSTRRRKVVFNMAATKLGYFTRICWPWRFDVSYWLLQRGSHSHWLDSRLWTKHRHAPVNTTFNFFLILTKTIQTKLLQTANFIQDKPKPNLQ